MCAFEFFHPSSPLSPLSLEPRLFIRGWGGSWMPQCEIRRDANPDRLVIKKPSERRKRRSSGRGGGRTRMRAKSMRWSRVESLLTVVGQHSNLWPQLLVLTHNTLCVIQSRALRVPYWFILTNWPLETSANSVLMLSLPLTPCNRPYGQKSMHAGQRNRGHIGFMSSFLFVLDIFVQNLHFSLLSHLFSLGGKWIFIWAVVKAVNPAPGKTTKTVSKGGSLYFQQTNHSTVREDSWDFNTYSKGKLILNPPVISKLWWKRTLPICMSNKAFM